MIARVLLLAALVLLCWPGGGTRLGDWHYAKRDGRSHLLDARGAPAGADAPFKTAGSASGTDIFGRAAAPIPAGMQAQLMHLRLRSRGLFRAEPGAHLALGLTAAWRKDNLATPVNDGLLSGRGIIVGNVSGARAGCALAPVIEIESFRRYGNRLYRASCSPPLREGAWYDLTLLVTRDGKIAYWLASADGSVRQHRALLDATTKVLPGRGGWWILHVFSNAHPSARWAVDIADLRLQWLRRVPPALLR